MAHPESREAAGRRAAIVTEFIEAWNRRDLPAIEARLAPDVVYHNIPMAPIAGRDAVMGVFEIRDGLIAAWRDYFDPRELQPGFQAGSSEFGASEPAR